MGYYKQNEINKNEWKAELEGPVRERRESTKDNAIPKDMEFQANLKEIMQKLERAEKEAVIEYYISITALCLISLIVGYWIARIWS